MKYTFTQKALAFSVHAFTSTGIVAGFMAIVAISNHEFKQAMLWIFATLIIDGVDGTFARLFKVREVLPNFDGKMIDYVIDFATYALIPAYFIYEAPILPEEVKLLGIAIILIVSALYYGLDGMVSSDYYFVGFPVMWNMVAFYLFFVIDLYQWVNFILVVFLAILHFVPVKFLYPSRTVKFRGLNLTASAVFIISNILIIANYQESRLELNEVNVILSWLSIACLLFFAWMGIYNTWLDKDTKNV
jgi:phosphatidylcholine synthase